LSWDDCYLDFPDRFPFRLRWQINKPEFVEAAFALNRPPVLPDEPEEKELAPLLKLTIRQTIPKMANPFGGGFCFRQKLRFSEPKKR